jgi:homoaconitase/3-isopropylmalate dehydratase large subunit
MVHFDAALGRHAHTGFTAGGERPIGVGALSRAGIGVLLGGRRDGKGSSREHSGLGAPLAALETRPRIDIAYGGSCTEGKREDFEQYHAVLAWAASRGLMVAPQVKLYLQFGTEDVREFGVAQGWLAAFEAVGARMLQPACGACANCGPGASTSSEQVTVSAINRDFPGRSGPGSVWLASPATVAASAIAGRLASFAELVGEHAWAPPQPAQAAGPASW